MTDKVGQIEGRDEVTILVSSAEAALAAGDFDDAFSYLDQALRIEPENEKIIELLTNARKGRKEYWTNHVQQFIKAGQEALDQGKLSEAQDRLKSAVELQNKHSAVNDYLIEARVVESLEQIKQKKERLSLLQQAQELFIQGEYKRAMEKLPQGNDDETRVLRSQIKRNQENLSQGKERLEQNYFPHALGLFEIVLESAPEDREAQRCRDDAMYRHQYAMGKVAMEDGDFDIAIHMFDKAMEIKPDGELLELRRDAVQQKRQKAYVDNLVEQGRAYFDAGGFGEAVYRFQQALEQAKTRSDIEEWRKRAAEKKQEEENRTLADYVQKGREALSNYDFGKAEEWVQAAQDLAVQSPLTLAFSKEVEAEKQNRAQVDRIIGEISESLKSFDCHAASNKLASLPAFHRKRQNEINFLREQTKILCQLHSAEHLLLQGQFKEAVEKLKSLGDRIPGVMSERFRNLNATAQVREQIERAEEMRKKGQLDEALQILANSRTVPYISDEDRERVKEKHEEIQRERERVQTSKGYEDKGDTATLQRDHEQAHGHYSKAVEFYPANREAQQKREESRIAWQKAQEKKRLIEDVDKYTAEKRFDLAEQALAGLESLDRASIEVERLKSEIKQGIEKQTRIESLVLRARKDMDTASMQQCEVDYESIIREWQRVLTEEPENSIAQAGLGEAQEKKKHWEEICHALKQGNEVMSRDPLFALEKSKHVLSKAIANAKALDLQAESVEMIVKKSSELARERKFEDALSLLDKALAILPTNDRLEDVARVTRSSNENYEKAKKLAQKASKAETPADEVKLWEEALSLTDDPRFQESHDSALRRQKETVAQLTDSANAWLNNRDHDKAIDVYQSALKQAPPEMKSEIMGKIQTAERMKGQSKRELQRLLDKAKREKDKGELQKAQETLEQVRDLSPDNEEARNLWDAILNEKERSKIQFIQITETELDHVEKDALHQNLFAGIGLGAISGIVSIVIEWVNNGALNQGSWAPTGESIVLMVVFVFAAIGSGSYSFYIGNKADKTKNKILERTSYAERGSANVSPPEQGQGTDTEAEMET